MSPAAMLAHVVEYSGILWLEAGFVATVATCAAWKSKDDSFSSHVRD